MDLYVEKQYVAQMKEGNVRQFMMLFDAYFVDLYRYVARRIGAGEEGNEVTRLTFLDALGQIQDSPEEGNYLVWLYSLARMRVTERLKRPGFALSAALIMSQSSYEALDEDKEALLNRFETMVNKLSMEEREILRLKFFEEVTDGDVMMVLEIDEGVIGSKIYKVLKRIHFLLFGESDERQGVYFGELAGFLSRVRELEEIQVPEALQLSVRADIQSRIDRRDFAVEAENVVGFKETPDFVSKDEEEEKPKGSNDPAKIFVEAVKEMREEEEKNRIINQERLERSEAVFDFVDRWKHALLAIPMVVFLLVIGLFTYKYFGSKVEIPEKIVRGFQNECDIEVIFRGDFSSGEKRSVNKGISDRICGYFDVELMMITRKDDGKVNVFVDVPDWLLRYRFAKKGEEWRIKQYARTVDRYQKYREV